MLVKFGEFAPDLTPSGSAQLVIARNVRAAANGYAPVKGFQAVTTALANPFVGGGAFIGSDGSSALLGATASNLYRYTTSWTSLLTVSTSQRWRFAQFGDNIIYANGGALGKFNMIGGTAAAISGAPTASDVATVRDFVVVLQPNGDRLQVRWSAFNDCTSWTVGTNQADFQPLLSGGKGVAIVGGEYGIILQANAIQRMTYTGDERIFQFDVVSNEVGCMAQGSVASVGRVIFFLSERGFQMFDRESVTPIGDEKFNRWFFDNYSRADIQAMWSAVDPRNSLVMWTMPGGRTLAYNWVLKRATTIKTDAQACFTGFTANLPLDALDAVYGNLDTIPVSLDDALFAGGNPLLLLVSSANVVGALTGPSLEATVKLVNIEPANGKRARVRSIRPDTDAVNVTGYVDGRLRPQDQDDVRTAAAMRGNGKMPVRANGRYLDIELTVPAGTDWTFLNGVEIEATVGEGR